MKHRESFNKMAETNCSSAGHDPHSHRGDDRALQRRLCPILLTFETDVARSRLYRSQSFQVNTHFAAFFKIYKIIGIKFLIFVVFSNLLHRFHNFVAISQIFVEEHRLSEFFCRNFREIPRNFAEIQEF